MTPNRQTSRATPGLRRRTCFKFTVISPLLVAALCGCDAVPPAALPVNSNTSGGNTAGATTGTTSNETTLSAVQSTMLEQLSLERINRARLRPSDEAASFGIDLSEGVPGGLSDEPRPALAMNVTLTQTARSHARDMLARDYFGHNTPEGKSPFDRMEDAGYPLYAGGENLAWRGTTGSLIELEYVEGQHQDLFVDSDIKDRGHRTTMLTAVFREIGIGVIRGRFLNEGLDYDSIMQAQDFGTTQAGGPFVLGVVFNDANNDGEYDFGEGVSNSSVTMEGVTKTTNAGGGYGFEILQAGSYQLRFASGRTHQLTIAIDDPNVKVDLVNGTNIVVNLGVQID